MNNYRRLAAVSLVVLAVFVAGCSTTKVKRIEGDEVIDFSGRWNDTDSRLTAKEMIDDSLGSWWLNSFYEKNKRSPVVIVGTITNKSHEHINSETFTKDLERSLMKSGRVKFVASRQERGEIREEREDQHKGYTAKETRRKIGQETGADYMLIGSINSITDNTKGRYLVLYEVNLEMIDLESNEKVWIGQKDIRKVVTKSKYSL
jgi:penicillin-binding protein activator